MHAVGPVGALGKLDRERRSVDKHAAAVALDDRSDDRQPEPGSRALQGVGARARSARTGARDCAGSGPVPSSRTVSSAWPSADVSATVTCPPSGPWTSAFSIRFSSTRRSASARPADAYRLDPLEPHAARRHRRGRGRPPRPARQARRRSARARRRRPARARADRRPAGPAERRRARRSASTSSSAPWRAAYSTLPSSVVTGVRSSCEASARNRRSLARELLERGEHPIEHAGQLRRSHPATGRLAGSRRDGSAVRSISLGGGGEPPERPQPAAA